MESSKESKQEIRNFLSKYSTGHDDDADDLFDLFMKPGSTPELQNKCKPLFMDILAEVRKDFLQKAENTKKEEEKVASSKQKEPSARTETNVSPKKPLKLEIKLLCSRIQDFAHVELLALESDGLFKFFLHCQTCIKESRLSLKAAQNKLSMQVLDVKKASSNNSEQNLTLELLPLYDIIPSFLGIAFKYGDNEIADGELDSCFQAVDQNDIIVSKQITQVNGFNAHNVTKEDDILIYSRFIKILQFFNRMPIAHFTPKRIQDFRDEIKKECAGFDYYADKIYDEFVATLTSSVYELPKGILFYGPPRTGKTHCSKKVIELLRLWRIHPDLAAGDFNKPYVGQSEQMINMITDRCDILPWELCCLFIDEIDRLCPNRKGEASSGELDLTSVFLSVMDGNKRKKNLMIIGTSNRLKSMDDAFLQRLDIKLFIGLPNVDSRRNWIDRITDQGHKAELAELPESALTIEAPKIERITALLKNELKDEILRYTVNFTADAMKKSLSQIMTSTFQHKKKFFNCSDKDLILCLKQLIYKSLNRICHNDKIYISIYTPPELVKELDNIEDSGRFKEVNWNILSNSSNTPQETIVNQIKHLLKAKDPSIVCLYPAFEANFRDYCDQISPDYKTMIKERPGTTNTFFNTFIKDIWPQLQATKKANSDEFTVHIKDKKPENYTQRMLIDLNEPAKERFQLEVGKSIQPTQRQLDLIKKLKHGLANKDPRIVHLLDDFEENFPDYYHDMQKDYKHTLQTMRGAAMEFFEIFLTVVWPRILNSSLNNSIATFGTSEDEFLISKHDALKILMRMAVESGINIVIVFDIAYFIKAGITSDEKMAQEILVATKEATQHDSCLVIFDLDSIADLNKEYINLQSDIITASQPAYINDRNDPQFACTSNQKQAFRAALECLAVVPNPDKNHWFVAISNNNKLTLDFKDKVNWPATNQQKKIEREILMNNIPKQCEFCFETFKEKDNDPNACGRHTSEYLYDEDLVNKLKSKHKDNPNYDPFESEPTIYIKKEEVFSQLRSKSMKKTDNDPVQAIPNNYSNGMITLSSKPRSDNGPSQNQEHLGRYKWACCQKSFWEKGEIKGKHLASSK